MTTKQLEEILVTLEFTKDVWYEIATIYGLIEVDIVGNEINVRVFGIGDMRWTFDCPKEALLKVLEFYPGATVPPPTFLNEQELELIGR